MSNILLIDDDSDFKESFKIEIQNQGLNLIHRRSFEGLQEIMPKHHNAITAIVLDIKCLISDDQAIENENFILTALKYLDTNFPNFPRIILTGDDDAFNHFKKFSEEENIYQKTPQDLTVAIEKLKEYSANSETIKITLEHPELFKIIRTNGYNQHAESTLIEILNNLSECSFAKFGGIFRDIRALQETIYKTINTHNKTVIPDHFIRSNGMIDFNPLMSHLSGTPVKHKATSTIYQNPAVFNLADALYWICGQYIHAEPNETYYISNYTIKSAANNLFELILWSKQYLPKP